MKTLYFDCFSGISGDMTIGALIDLGVDFDYVRTELSKLPIPGFRAAADLSLSRVDRSGIRASKFDVRVPPESGTRIQAPTPAVHAGHRHDAPEGHRHESDAAHTHQDHPGHVHRTAADIIGMIASSPLEARVRDRAVGIFEKLAVSEGMVHDVRPEDVTFHEVGAVDSIVDVVGAAIGIESLGVERFACSPINVGAGFIHCQHGVYPVPAPATANLLTAATVYSKHVEKELVTPTGAAILAATVDTFERFAGAQGMRVDRVGYGAGTMDFPDFPNCLRLFLGDVVPGGVRSEDGGTTAAGVDQVVLVETNIDDMTAEQLAYASERLMSQGALDVTIVPVVMKKGRPGHTLQVMTTLADEGRLTRTVFEETTTIGVRSRRLDRRVLDRKSVRCTVAGGTVRVKVSGWGGETWSASPEFEDCVRIARATGRPLRDVQEEALSAYHNPDKERS